MSIEKELHIRMTLDRSQAKREMDSHERESKRALKNVGDAAKETETSTSTAMNALGGLVPAITAVGAATAVFNAVNQGVKETSEHVKALAEDFIRTRDNMRELAGILGQKGDINFTQGQYDFAAKAGMDVNEAGRFRSAFQGEAQQYKGKFADAGQFDQFERQAARMASSMGLESGVAAKMAGGIIRSMKQGSTSQDAMLALGQSFGTLQAGSGDNPVLAGQLAQTIGSMVGEGQAFGTAQEAAVGVRVMAESNQGEAFTRLQAIRRGILQLKPAEKAALGIDAKTGFFDAMRKISEKSKQAQAGGATADEFLMKYFEDARTREGLAVMLSRGVDGGVIDKGFEDVNNVHAGDTESKTDAAFADPSQAMMLRQAAAERKAREAKLGHDKALIAPYLERAKAGLAEHSASPVTGFMRGLSDSVGGFLGLKALGGASLNSQQVDEYQAAVEDLNKQAKDAGLNVPRITQGEVTGDTRALEKHMAQIAELLREANAQRAKQGVPNVPPVMNGRPSAPGQMPR